MVSLKESVDDGAIDVDFGVDNVPSRYASGMRMRSGSPAISEASSCTLAGDGPEAEADSNCTLPSSTALHTQAYSSSPSESPSTSESPAMPSTPTTPATPATLARKRRREDGTSSNLLLMDRETSNKRRTGALAVASISMNAGSGVSLSPAFPQTAILNHVPLDSLGTPQSNPRANSPSLPIRLGTPRATTSPLRTRETHLSVSPKEIIDLDSEEHPTIFKLPDGAVLIDLEDYEGEARLEEEIFGIEPQLISQDSIRRASLAQRNPKILPPNVEITSIPWKNQGWKLVRTREFTLGGMVQKKRNEVAFIHEIDRDDRRDVLEQSVNTARLEDVWRDEAVQGSSRNSNGGDSSSSTRSRYTYGDGYCGAGGMTAGAAAAGFNVKWGFDFNSNAGLTWQKNFPLAKFHLLPVHEFADLPDPHHELWIDILHLSPPCQVFSPAHTVPDLGFDVSWQVVKFQGYGSPSRRTRLIILAACPGEPLPHMPQYTYTEPFLSTASQKPYRTPNEALSSIPANAPNHDPQNPQLHRSNYVPWDGSVICGCILTGGGIGLGLPNGSRGMTNRELAALQTFPLQHVFHGQEIRRQVGNAVPPVFGKILLGSLRRQLERRDGWARKEGIVISSDEE
ncbi:hypothetical protein EYC84_003289 [Monilinia fructicola]|uniref:DNA (cytosine-5-)-methyltransferase n=1 Tax=Monilinia fructicola TaxID=38448 RepID=A0A5M9JT63_MONFR|nr:hypothetical protein EYC84_003289 [Monilinia fructicola]